MQEQLKPGPAFAVQSYDDARASGVSWAAVFAGAAAAAALSFVLLVLGMGLGLSSVSPYAYNAAPLGAAAIGWIAFMQLAASGVGGYLAGRLRLKWAQVHGDEVYFRDTAHGLLAWSVATLCMVALLAGGVKAVLGGAIDAGTAAGAAGAAVAGESAAPGKPENRAAYFSDMLLRSPAGDTGSDSQRREIGQIVALAIADGRLSADDRSYLAQIVARRAGVDQNMAERRVDEIYARGAKAAADARAQALQSANATRKAAAHSALWMFVALLFGAFIASLAATFGGRQRDDMRLPVSASL